MNHYKCWICPRVMVRPGMCELCQRAYDRQNKKDGTTDGLIKWVANSAVRELENLRRGKKYR